MKKRQYILWGIFFLYFAGPSAVFFSGQLDLTTHWRLASRRSANLAPDPHKTKIALVQVYAARTYGWRGAFAVHTWIAVKPKNTPNYIIYQALGWNFFRGLPYVDVREGVPDAYWFGQKPKLLFSLKGIPAEKAIREINQAVKQYPYKNYYIFWPGPNSNTFTAYVIRHAPLLHFPLPVTAIGKDYLENNLFLTNAPSGTGWQFSIKGILGLIIAGKEGVEFNLLGLNIGVRPDKPFIHLPGLG